MVNKVANIPFELLITDTEEDPLPLPRKFNHSTKKWNKVPPEEIDSWKEIVENTWDGLFRALNVIFPNITRQQVNREISRLR